MPPNKSIGGNFVLRNESDETSPVANQGRLLQHSYGVSLAAGESLMLKLKSAHAVRSLKAFYH